MRIVCRSLLFTAVLALTAASAAAQVHLEILGGVTSAATRDPLVGAGLGFKVSFVEIDAEVGRMQNILPRGILDLANQLQQDRGLAVQGIASVPATYALASVRVIGSSGPLKPFLSAGLGIARLEPRFEVTVQGISLGDVFGLTRFDTQQKGIAALGAGLRVDAGKVFVEGAYRYFRVFTDFDPSSLGTGRVVTNVNSAHVGIGIKF
jgi:hypothetical protein